jgi:predicted DNA-binding protein (MmcQ/YjbR family)
MDAMSADAFHDRLLAIVKKLPEAEEDWPWGSIHCKVAGKIFVGWGRDESGIMSIGIRTTPELQSMLVKSDPRFSVAKYTGKYGGIDMRLGPKPNWSEVEQFIVESYRIIAPKRLVRLLDERSDAPATPRAKKKKAPARRPAKKTARKRSRR